MLQKNTKKTPSTSLSFKENKPTNTNASQSSKTSLDNDRPLSKSTHLDHLKPSHRHHHNKKKISAKDVKPMPKSVIKEKPNRAPSKDWNESPPDSGPKEKEMPRTPIHSEKVSAYEMHFPALGSENSKVETPPSLEKAESLTFSTEILSPTNVALYQVYKDSSEISSILLQSTENLQEKMDEMDQKQEAEEEEMAEVKEKKFRVVKDEKIVEYENHFPELGTEQDTPKPDNEFHTEVLSPKHLTAVATNIANIPVTSVQGDWESMVPSNEAQETTAELLSLGLIKEQTSQSQQNVELEDSEYIKIESQTDVPTQIEFAEKVSSSKVEVHTLPIEEQTHLNNIKKELDRAVEEEEALNSRELLDSKPFCIVYKELAPQIPLDSTNEDVEPEPSTVPEDAQNAVVPSVFDTEEKKGIEAEEFEVMLATEIEQLDEAAIIATEDIEEKFEGEEQRAKQDIELKQGGLEADIVEVDEDDEEEEEVADRESYKPIRLSVRDDEVDILLGKEEEEDENDEEVVDEEFGNYKTAGTPAVQDTVQVEVQPQIEELIRRSADEAPATADRFGVIEASRKSIDDQEDLKSVEEEIDELEAQDMAGEEIKGLERNELIQERNIEPQEHAKAKIRSSLEHIAEDPSLSQSTDLTLSAQRIDLIKEEIREADERKKNQDALFQEIEKNLTIVKDLETSKMYGAAINVLKKSIDALDTRLVRHHDTNTKEANRLLVECNLHIASCFGNANEFRLSIDYAHNVLKLDSKNIKALYLLGTSLFKCRDSVGGYNALKDARDFAVSAQDQEYIQLIDAELRKQDKKLEQSKGKVEQTPTPGAPQVLPVTNRPINKEVRRVRKPESSSRAGSLACFVGTAMSSGLASWFITKNYMKLSEKKSLAYSIGIGALIGGISVLILGHTRSTGKK